MMTLLNAVTKKRRNLHRIEQAFRTEWNNAVYRRDEVRAVAVQNHRKHLTDDVLRIYDAEVKAALKAERMAL
jgi:predicted AlkP superfamily phosphohydrolase/phosphomutase